jgi:hypothetical protein
MSRTLKTVAVVVAIVAVLTLVVSGTVYAFRGAYCGSGDSDCAQQHQAGCIGSGRCAGSGDCTGTPRCNTDSQA